MVKVKICGITSLDDAQHAIDCGADALGFVFFHKSPRAIAAKDAAAIIAKLPPFVTAVGLFVNEYPAIVRQIAELCRLDLIQYHGDETPEIVETAPRRAIRALRIKDAEAIAHISEVYRNSSLLLDAWSADAYGGTGQLCNWEVAAEIARIRPVILAGGLNPENVAAAVQTVRPYGVDVSTGVEAAPGKKDPAKVAAFIKNAKLAAHAIKD